MKKILSELGPVLAGFQLATYVVGFFGIGAFASWILERWRPFTHWLWDELFKWLRIPNLSELEKDALTAIMFFLPMAVWALVNRYVKKEKGPFSITVLIVSVVCSVFFIGLIAGEIVIESIRMIIDVFFDLISQSELLAMISAISAALLLSASFSLIRLTNSKLQKFSDKLIGNIVLLKRESSDALTSIVDKEKYSEYSAGRIKKESDYLNPSRLNSLLVAPVRLIHVTSKAFDNMFNSVDRKIAKLLNIIESEKFKNFVEVYYPKIAKLFRIYVVALLITMAISGMILAVGWVRTICILGVLSCIVVTLKFDPKRILVTTGAFLSFVFASLGYELAVYVSSVMGQATQ